MKKKIVILLALAAAAMMALGALSACKKEEEHVLTHHDAVAATCTETGTVEYWSCSECGKNFADEAAQEELTSLTVSALGHDFGAWTTEQSATCSEKGKEVRSCARCGEEESREIETLGHEMEHHKAVEATCTEDGTLEYWSCGRCGKNFADEAGSSELTSLVAEKLGHDWSEWEVVVLPKCTEDGEQRRTCSRCESEEYVPVKAPGHRYGEWMLTSEPTCTEKGLEQRACSDCKTMETRDIDALGHEFVNMMCIRCGASQESSGFKFKLNADGKSYTLTGAGQNNDSAVYIPVVYQGYPVTVIGAAAFRNRTRIESVRIPVGVTTIEAQAFEGCSKLKEVQMGNTVSSIGERAFYGTALVKISLPDSLTLIGDKAFADCSELTEIALFRTNPAYSVINGDLYNKAGTVLIQYAVGKEDASFRIPDGVEEIDRSAFLNAANLKSVSIPASVKVLGDRVFGTCTALEEIRVDEKNTVYRSRGGDLYTADSSTLLQYAIGKNSSSFLSTDDVKTIAAGAFEGALSLKEVTLSATLSSIGEGAFRGCTALTKIVLPKTLKTIGKGAFSGCAALEEIVIPASVSSIGEAAFEKCEALKKVSFAETSGWSVGGKSLSAESLSNPETAATYLKNVELAGEWTRR